MGKWYSLIISTDDAQEAHAIVTKIPGVAMKQAMDQYVIYTPWNALPVVRQQLKQKKIHALDYAPTKITQLQSLPTIPELREWVPQFLTQYQKEALLYSIPQDGFSIWHSTGCLTGDTKLVINRSGNAQVFELKTIVKRLQGKETSGRNGKSRGWDLNIPTYTQSVDENGFIRLNEIVKVWENGTKPVYKVTTASGRTITATKEHKFLSQGQYRQLEELKIGDSVSVADWPRLTQEYLPQEDWPNEAGKLVNDPILAIDYAGEEPVYDLTMADPYHNYVANEFAVHNSGKSLTAICWAIAQPGTIIFITRAAARKTIANEVEKYTTIRPYILEGESVQVIPLNERLIVLGWETLPFHVKQLIKLKPTSIVFDEAHKGKSHKRWESHVGIDGKPVFTQLTNIAAAANQLTKVCSRRLATTATPIKDRVRDLWAQMDLIEPGQWGAYWNWAKRYCNAFESEWGMDDKGRSNEDELSLRLAQVTHAVPYAVTHRDLPPKRRQCIKVGPNEQNAPSGFSREIKKLARTGGEPLLELRLQEAASRKRKFVVQLVIDQLNSKGKVVVFTGRKQDCEILGEAVQKAAPKNARIWTAHGDTSIKLRDEIREAYMKSEGPACIVGTGDAWGESLSLHDTDLGVFAQLPYTPGQIRQWEGRFCRLGQKRPVLIAYVVAEGTVDEHIASILLDKLPAVQRIIGDTEIGGVEATLIEQDEEKVLASILSKL